MCDYTTKAKVPTRPSHTRWVRDSRSSNGRISVSTILSNPTSTPVVAAVMETLPGFYHIDWRSYNVGVYRMKPCASTYSNENYCCPVHLFTNLSTSKSEFESDRNGTWNNPRSILDLPGASLVLPHAVGGKDRQGSVYWSIPMGICEVAEASFIARKRHLHREEYPSHASRGMEVPPVLVVWSSQSSSYTGSPLIVDGLPLPMGTMGGCSNSILSTSIGAFALVSLPIPDATMPFNTVTLVFTIAAFLLGSLVNLLGKAPVLATKNKADMR